MAKNPHKALLETMVGIILKTPWELCKSPVDVGMGSHYTVCKFCGFSQLAQFYTKKTWGTNYYDLKPEHLIVQEELEDPSKHLEDCLWRLAKEYRK